MLIRSRILSCFLYSHLASLVMSPVEVTSVSVRIWPLSLSFSLAFPHLPHMSCSPSRRLLTDLRGRLGTFGVCVRDPYERTHSLAKKEHIIFMRLGIFGSVSVRSLLLLGVEEGSTGYRSIAKPRSSSWVSLNTNKYPPPVPQSGLHQRSTD